MKSQDLKLRFIELRADGKSYVYIAKELDIAKGTCSKWETELKEQISELKKERLKELYDTYYMTREARIKKLGGTLQRIDEALTRKDLEEATPEKLLELKLKYEDALKSEYIDLQPPNKVQGSIDTQFILNLFNDLLNRIRAGEVTAKQASKENVTLMNMLKAYEQYELKEKIEALESVIGGR
ncbi:hypothetical protein RG959_22990 [Domibacillus sp. 8LH]|uniref:hypothetical protein n=1 Tax=Domibacillus sp. 8LH TaxID=3073900 RepID=UPI003172E13E